MSPKQAKTPNGSWAKGLEDPQAAWQTAVAGPVAEPRSTMLGNLVNALSDLTGRWLRYDEQREAEAEQDSQA